MHRAIPPDSAHAGLPVREGVQHEAVGDLYFAADNFGAAVESYAAALRDAAGRPSSDRLRILLRVARAQDRRGDFGASLESLQSARELTHGDTPATGEVAARMAWAFVQRGQYARGRRYGLFAYRALRNGDDHHTVGELGVTLGVCYARLGRNAEAIEWLQDAAATFRRIDDSDGLVTALNNLGLVYKNLREWREATRFLEQALRIDERAGLYSRMRGHHGNLGLIRYYLGQWDLAEEDFRKSLQIARDTGHRQGEAGALMALGKDHFILLGVLKAGELGHPHLVAMRFQKKPAQHIGEMSAEFPPLDGMAPQLVQRAFDVFQSARHFRLTAGHQRRVDGGLYQLRQMLDLFELAAGIRVQPAIVGEDMQCFQQGH